MSIELVKTRFQNGKVAFENGKYREAIENLETARDLVELNTRLGGDIQIWLATAYEAAGRNEEAVELCEKLKRHPHYETSKEAKRLHYILKAPRLQRPKEWMTEIPDFSKVRENEEKATIPLRTNKSSKEKVATEPEFIDLSQVNTKDNGFIWVALIGIALTLGGLVWFGLN